MSISTLTRIDEICSTISETYRGKDKKVILINTSDVLEGKILNFEEVENKNLRGQFKKTFKKNDILFSEIRPANKRFAFVNIDDTHNFIASTKLMVLRPNLKRVLPEFLYYILSSDYLLSEMQHLAETRSGTFPQITFSSELGPFEIELPDINCQRKIVSILKNIDEKIELNNEINDNLLKQAIEIYSDLIKDKDKNGCIGDYCTIKSGFAFKSNWWTDNGVKVVKIGSINQDNLDLNSCSYVSSENAVRAKEFIVKGGDLLIAMTGATIGKFAMVPSLNEGIYVNQRVGKFFLGDNPISRLPYIYCTLKQPDIYSEIINRGQGSAQPNISGGDIMSIPCVILSKEDIDDFNQKCKPIFSLMIDRQKENADLSDLRDSLLPKLMSGEIDVDSIEL